MSVDDLKNNIRAVLIPNKEGLPSNKFVSEYMALTCETINPQRYGFNDINHLMRSIPDVVRIENLGGGGLLNFRAVADATTAGIQSLVMRQKTKKKKGGAMAARGARGRTSAAAATSRNSTSSYNAPRFRPMPPSNPTSTPSIPPLMSHQQNFQPAANTYPSMFRQQPQIPSQFNGFHPSNFQFGANNHPSNFQFGANNQPSNFQFGAAPSIRSCDSQDLGGFPTPPVNPAVQHQQLPSFPDPVFSLPPVSPVTVGCTYKAHLVHQLTPSEFFLHIEPNHHIEEIMDACNEASRTGVRLASESELSEGQYLLYKAKHDNSWCRGRIKYQGRVHVIKMVFLLDFGNPEKLDITRAMYFPPQLTKWPPAARKCRLADTEPATGGGWSADAIHSFNYEMDETELELLVTSVNPADSSVELEVELTRTDTNRNIAVVLHEADLANYSGRFRHQIQGESRIEKWIDATVDQVQRQDFSPSDGDHSSRLHPDTPPGDGPRAAAAAAAADIGLPVPEGDISPDGADPAMPSKCVLASVEDSGEVILHLCGEGLSYLEAIESYINSCHQVHEFSTFVSEPTLYTEWYVLYDERRQLFLRGVLTGRSGDTFEAYFADYGYTRTVPSACIRDCTFLQPTFTRLQPQAQRFTLAHVQFSEYHREYLQSLVDGRTELTCWTLGPGPEDDLVIILQLGDGRMLHHVLPLLQPRVSRPGCPNILRMYENADVFNEVTSNFHNSHPGFTPLQLDVERGDVLTFRVLTVVFDTYMKIIPEEHYPQFELLNTKLERACQQLSSVPMAQIKSQEYYIVKKKYEDGSEDEYFRAKATDNIADLFHNFIDVDTGVSVNAPESQVYPLPVHLRSDLPLYSVSAAFYLMKGKLGNDWVGRRMSCAVVRKTPNIILLQKPEELP